MTNTYMHFNPYETLAYGVVCCTTWWNYLVGIVFKRLRYSGPLPRVMAYLNACQIELYQLSCPDPDIT